MPKFTIMSGLLKEKSEIQKIQKEFKILTETNNKKIKKNPKQKEKLMLEECL